MAGRKFTRSGARKIPIQGGNRIRTHPSKGKRKLTAAKETSERIGQEWDRLRPCAKLLREIQQQLEIVTAHVIVVRAALDHQSADRDSDVAHVLRRSVGDLIWVSGAT